ncbi:MAG: sugar phosphate isomerase/epimerase [Methanospirillaceae archaeon]|nr:sugar phosphate isomerase/epimerase [Methanospirillaceae archaeon]
MVRIAASSMFLHEKCLDEIFACINLTGLDSLEFWLETPDFWLRGLPESYFLEISRKYPALWPLSVHAPVLDLNPCSINPDVAEISVQWTCNAVTFADAIHASVCTIHPGRRTAHRPVGDLDWKRLFHLLESVQSVQSSCSCVVAIENMEPRVNALLSNPEEMIQCLESFPWLFCTIDICHAYRDADLQPALDFIDRCIDKAVNIHVSRPGPAGLHQPVAGDSGSTLILEAIRDAGYSGLITSEINDLTANIPPGSDEKISVLKREGEFIRAIFDG